MFIIIFFSYKLNISQSSVIAAPPSFCITAPPQKHTHFQRIKTNPIQTDKIGAGYQMNNSLIRITSHERLKKLSLSY